MSMISPSVMMSKMKYLRGAPGPSRSDACAMSQAAEMTGEKHVGPLSLTLFSACRYAATMPGTPAQPGAAGLPFSAKQCATWPVGICAP